MNIEDLSDCMENFNQCCNKLHIIENKIIYLYKGEIEYIKIDHFSIDKIWSNTEIIIYATNTYLFEENELIHDWNMRYSSYLSYLKEDFSEKYIELSIFNELCHYHYDCSFKSIVDVTNIHYQNILDSGKWDVIPALIKYISFGWPVFSLLAKISGNRYEDFNLEWSGIVDKVTEYWLNWAKENGY